MTIADLKYNDQGLIPAVAQDAETGEVLMMAWMNREAVEQTVATRRGTYWSRSRQELWVKGAGSGHVQRVKAIKADCDADALLLQIEQVGAACHEGYRSCFFRELDPETGEFEVCGEPLTESY
jgi:phosphoribosyl-AMP cyclohydrolase